MINDNILHKMTEYQLIDYIKELEEENELLKKEIEDMKKELEIVRIGRGN
jgi:hypothetical protein